MQRFFYYGSMSFCRLVVFKCNRVYASIEQHGGKASGSISSKTTYLLAGAKMGPEKLRKAQQLGVPILTEAEYLQLIGQ